MLRPWRGRREPTLGGLAGFASGFLGIGGGLVIVPGLLIALRCPIKQAVGTSLSTIVAVSAIGVLVEIFVKGSSIHCDVAFVLTLGSLLGSWIGKRIIPHLPDQPLRLLFAGLILFAAFRRLGGAPGAPGVQPVLLSTGTAAGFLYASSVGALAGLCSVLFGIGGGLVVVPAFTLLSDPPFHVARATSLVTMIPTSGFGAYLHRKLGTTNASLAFHLIPGAWRDPSSVSSW